jgi:cell division protein FtsI (penicillin-binding protein 3)
MKIIISLLILFLIILSFKINIIKNDTKIKEYLKKQYFKKNKNIKARGKIYDKNNILINYNKKKYKYTKNNKKYIFEKREYLFPSCISITGIVNNLQDGLSGLELYFNNYLQKNFKKSFNQRDTAKEKFSQINIINNKKNIYTTIDATLSEEIYKLLNIVVNKFNSEYATCIIMDGQKGDIEVLTQYPQYNEENKLDIDIKYLYPLSITQSHEIGSVIKVFLMISALNENIVNPETEINCFGIKEKKIQGKILSTWKAHGKIPFKTVIKESNNFGVAQVGLKLGEKLYFYYNNLGFGKKTNIPIFGETAGILNQPSFWSKRTPISLSFGYEMSCSLIQLVKAWSLFTNYGKTVNPKIIKTKKTLYSDIFCNLKSINEAKEILLLDQLKLKSYGLKNQLDCKLYGKTGTANILIDKQYNKDQNSYTFVGHIEKNEQTKIIGIFIYKSNDYKLLASQVALPIFLDIATILNKIIK